MLLRSSMYQPPRPSLRSQTSAASSPRTNPLRSNNDREDAERRNSGFDPSMPGNRAMGDSGSSMGSSQNIDDRQAEQAREAHKLNQIIQVRLLAFRFLAPETDPSKKQFFAKGALTIVSSRVTLPPAYSKAGGLRQNKWVRSISFLFLSLSRSTVHC